MFTQISIRTFVAYTLVIVVSILGTLIAIEIFPKYKAIVDGILGLVIYSFIFRFIINSKKQQPDWMAPGEALFIFPENIKLFVRSLFWPMVLYWAFRVILNTILYLIQLAGSGA